MGKRTGGESHQEPGPERRLGVPEVWRRDRGAWKPGAGMELWGQIGRGLTGAGREKDRQGPNPINGTLGGESKRRGEDKRGKGRRGEEANENV